MELTTEERKEIDKETVINLNYELKEMQIKRKEEAEDEVTH